MMLKKTNLTPISLTCAAVVGAAGGVLSLPSSAHGLGLTFQKTDWGARGDVLFDSSGRVIMTNALPDGGDDNGVNYNVSGNIPVAAFDLEEELGLPDATLGLEAGETSGAIQQALTVQQGDFLSFRYNFLTNHVQPDPLNFSDYAFVLVKNEVDVLFFDKFVKSSGNFNRAGGSLLPSAPNFARETGLQTYTSNFAFAQGGDYTVVIGVVDAGVENGPDFITSSALTLEKTAISVPEPATLLGSGVALGFGVFFKKSLRRTGGKDDQKSKK